MKTCFLILLGYFFFTFVACGDEDSSSNLPTLQEITVSSGTLIPDFDPSITSYVLYVSNSVDTLAISPLATDTNTAIIVHPYYQPMSLSVGYNQARIWITFSDESAQQNYWVTIYRASTNAFLGSLTVDTEALTPTFLSNTLQYVANVGNAVTDFNVLAAVAMDSNSIIEFSPSSAIPLVVGSNGITITVTAQYGTTTKQYLISVNRNGTTPSDITSTTLAITLKGVPAGTFQRDSTSTNSSYISSFHISECEITRTQFNTIMGADPSVTASSSGMEDPVQNINWYHAIAFCNKLSIADGYGQVYTVSGVDFSTLSFTQIPLTNNVVWNNAIANWTASGYRLPTMTEWQWAAMGASDSRNKAFAGSTGNNSVGDYVWYQDNSNSKTHPVGTKLPNELGLYDMSGNVWNWCWGLEKLFPPERMDCGSQRGYFRNSACCMWRGLLYFKDPIFLSMLLSIRI